MAKSITSALAIAATCLATLLLSGCTDEPEAAAPPKVVTGFKIERYAGTWYQVAAIPAWFQEDCVSDTRADYTIDKDGQVAVVNSCTLADGSTDQAEGRARFTGEPGEAKLEVTFVDVIGMWFWPAAGDYWVIGLDAGYRWSVVGGPKRNYAWLLARSPQPDRETLNAANDILKAAGYDACDLLITSAGYEGRLCDYAE